jgi:PAS domain S-box-containing protein
MPAALGQPFIEAVMSSLGEGVYAVDLDGMLTYMNPAAEELLGWKRAELQGREIHAFAHAHPATGPCPCRVAMQAGSLARREHDLFLVRGGRVIDVAWVAAPIMQTEEVVGAVVTFRDVTSALESARALRTEAQRNEVLVHFARELSADLEITSILQSVTDTGVMLVRAAFGAFFYSDAQEDGAPFTRFAVSGAPRDAFATLPLPGATALFEPTFRDGQSVRSDDVTAEPLFGTTAPFHGMPEGHLPVRSYLAVPVISRSSDVIGALFFGHPEVGVFTDDDVRLMEGVAAHAAVVIDNAQLFDQEQKLAETLQRSLLPRELPRLSGLRFASRYVPASAQAEVGGDWYDVVSLPNGNVAAVIGDVAGHSIQAATVMGQIRNALRGYALEGHPPASVMDRANRFLALAEPGVLVTCCYAEIDREQGIITLVSAGHPPPIVSYVDGPTEQLAVAPGPPMGVDDDTSFSETTVLFDDRAVLVLYTDGLIERRGRSLDDGIDALITRLRDVGRIGAEEVADRALEGPGASPPADDTAVLVISLDPGGTGAHRMVSRRLPCNSASPGVARRFVVDVLVGWGLGQFQETVRLLVSELVTNAVRHTATELMVRLMVDGGCLRCEVVDGSPVVPTPSLTVQPDATSGRGLMLVDLLSERWGVDDHPTGKVVWFELGLGAERSEALLGA